MKRITRNRRGFTLVDLAITVLIIGILSAVAAPRFFGALEFYRADAAATRIAADLRYARGHARSTGSEETVSFDVANDRYSLSSAKDLDHPTEVLSVDMLRTPYPAVLVSADFGGNPQVTFNAYGVPDQGGQIIVQSGSYQRTVALDANTGRTTVQ